MYLLHTIFFTSLFCYKKVQTFYFICMRLKIKIRTHNSISTIISGINFRFPVNQGNDPSSCQLGFCVIHTKRWLSTYNHPPKYDGWKHSVEEDIIYLWKFNISNSVFLISEKCQILQLPSMSQLQHFYSFHYFCLKINLESLKKLKLIPLTLFMGQYGVKIEASSITAHHHSVFSNTH